MTITCLIPCYNESDIIASTIESVLANTVIPDHVVVIPNGCTDDTAEIARQYENRGVIVLELPRLKHTKSEALNVGWNKFGQDSDIVVSIDADTQVPPETFESWIKEFESDQPTTKRGPLSKPLGSSSLKFTLVGNGLLARVQRVDFSMSIDVALRRGYTTVAAGAGSAYRGDILRHIAARDDRQGPWSYDSQVEDYELTYRIRELGYRCHMSKTVRGYTDNMKNVRALYGQRMKWQIGTIDDLVNLQGFNKLTWIDWRDQMLGLLFAVCRLAWFTLMAVELSLHAINVSWVWWLAVPAISLVFNLNIASRIPGRDWKDFLIASLLLPYEAFGTFRSAIVIKAWIELFIAALVPRYRRDYWKLQHKAEGMITAA